MYSLSSSHQFHMVLEHVRTGNHLCSGRKERDFPDYTDHEARLVQETTHWVSSKSIHLSVLKSVFNRSQRGLLAVSLSFAITEKE